MKKVTGVKDEFGRVIKNGDHNVRASNKFVVSGTSEVFNGSTSLGETPWEIKFVATEGEKNSLGLSASDQNRFEFTLTSIAP
ncbi:hypothetical protein [Pseudomonas fluorescens]|uniref:hypothetical protein n=1 Tax=Pseudomonas fluorescens TaxID=294 RepID=UPI0017869583|nr:hypothetical protein [Pseudomonas fluorescens]